MSFWDNINTLFFGGKSASEKQKKQYDKIADYDGRAEDFKNLSGQVLNNMANRGIINSSVTGKALSGALNDAENSYWNDQMKLLSMPYGSSSSGIAPYIMGGITKSMGRSLFR